MDRFSETFGGGTVSHRALAHNRYRRGIHSERLNGAFKECSVRWQMPSIHHNGLSIVEFTVANVRGIFKTLP